MLFWKEHRKKFLKWKLHTTIAGVGLGVTQQQAANISVLVQIDTVWVLNLLD